MEITLKSKSAVNFKPTQDRLLVRKVTKEEVSPGGIFIPDSAVKHDNTQLGEVVATGPGKPENVGHGWHTRPLSVKAGDTIMFMKTGGLSIKVDGQDFLIVFDEDVLGTIK
jgi:chaperonin GroES